MTSGKDIRDQQSEYRQSIGQRFIKSAEQHPAVTKAARAAAEAAVRQQDKTSFEDRVNAALEDQASKTGADDETQEGN